MNNKLLHIDEIAQLEDALESTSAEGEERPTMDDIVIIELDKRIEQIKEKKN